MLHVVRPQAFDEFGACWKGYIAVVVRLHQQHGGVPRLMVAWRRIPRPAVRIGSVNWSPTEDRYVTVMYTRIIDTAASASEARANRGPS